MPQVGCTVSTVHAARASVWAWTAWGVLSPQLLTQVAYYAALPADGAPPPGCAGAFPLWLAPVQVCLLLVADTEELHAYADSVAAEMRSAGLRVDIKSGEESETESIQNTTRPRRRPEKRGRLW